MNLCRRLVATGIHRDGGFAEFAAFPAERAFLLPDALDPLHGAFAEPLACTLHGLDLAALQPGERALILGGGVIGLLALQLARLGGAETLLLTRHPKKRDLALSLGADHAAADPEAARKIWPEGADCVLECAGVPETMEAAPRLARRGGKAVILGVLASGARVKIEPFDLLFREIALLHSFINPFTQARAASLISSGRIALAPLISRTIPLAEAPEAIANPARPGEVKVLVLPQG